MTPHLTLDARRTLSRAGFSRRAFLHGSGALIVSFATAKLVTRVQGSDEVMAQGFNGTGSRALDAWIAIAQDGRVTAYTGKCEFGQGLQTAQMQLSPRNCACRSIVSAWCSATPR
jgi:hypothetical protein